MSRTAHLNHPIAGWEPSVDDMLADPLVHAVMARDNVSIKELEAVITDARAKLRTRQ